MQLMVVEENEYDIYKWNKVQDGIYSFHFDFKTKKVENGKEMADEIMSNEL